MENSNTQLPAELDVDILWDEHSALIGEDIDDLNYWSGRDVMKKDDFLKAIAPFVTKLHQTELKLKDMEIYQLGYESFQIENRVLKAKCERYETALVEIKKKADHGWPKDLAVGTKSGTACIQIYNIADEALSAGEGEKEVDNG